MGKKLITYVHVADENGEAHAFGPGDDVPDWAEKKITNPHVWEGASASDPPRVADPGNSGAPVGEGFVEPEPVSGAEPEPESRRRPAKG